MAIGADEFMDKPLIIVVAGPNGAGKSTAAAHLLPPGITFLNADEMAKLIPGYPSQAADIQAGRLLLSQMDELEGNRASFSVETTLASRSLAPRITRLRSIGYEFRLSFAFLPDPEMAVSRVAGRVRQGGHNIPIETIRRRYRAGILNFFELYQPLADQWFVFDTTSPAPLKLIAEGIMGEVARVEELVSWNLMKGWVDNG
jgi:predicted ABC-type ATPase